MKIINIIYVFLIFLFLCACKKEAGEGGTSTITGRIKVVDYDYNPVTGNWVYVGQYYPPKERVYIIYGDNDVYNDNFRTDPDGYYQFEWLHKGTYTIFAYSDDTTCANPPDCNGSAGEYPVEITVEINENKKTVEAPEITIIQ